MKKHYLNSAMVGHFNVKLYVSAILFFTLTCFSCAYAQNNSNTTILCDTFEGATISRDWLNDGSWSIKNNAAYNLTYGGPLLSAASYDEPTYIVESSLSNLVTGYNRAYRFFFGVNAGNLDDAYVFTIDAYGLENRLFLGKSDGNYFFPTVLDIESYPIDPSRDYSFKIEKYANGLIQIFLNEGNGYLEEPILEAMDDSYLNLGQFGWDSYTETSDEDFFINDICVTVPDFQKTLPEKSTDAPGISSFYTRDVPEPYQTGTLQVGAEHYIDRTYVITSVPAYLEGATLIKTANNDKVLSEPEDLLFAYFDTAKIAYVAYDPRATVLPEWLQSWTKTDDVIGSTDIGTSTFDLYKKNIVNSYFYTGSFSLQTGANLASPARNSRANYFIILKDIPDTTIYEAEDATLNSTLVAKNHYGYSGRGFADFINPSNDYIEWNVTATIPGNYEFKFRYALGSPTIRPMELSVDGVVVDIIDFNSTTTWKNWLFGGNGEKYVGFLSEGNHSIRLKAIGASGPNIDYLQLSYTDNDQNSKKTFEKNSVINESAVSLNNVVVYPNPGSTELIIDMPLQTNNVGIKVYDLQGRLMYQHNGPIQSAIRINSTTWNPGIYIYKIMANEDPIITGKWVAE